MSQTGIETWRERLARLLFSNDATAIDDQAWRPLFKGAGIWSVVPQTAAALRRQSVETSVEGWPEFKRICLATQARSAMRASKGLEALRQLQRASVPALAFKGLASMASIYRIPAERTIADADILITQETVPRAMEALAELNYRPASGQEFAKVERFLEQSPGFAGNKAIALYGPAHAEVDLHWSVGLAHIPPELLLARSEKATLMGTELRVLCPVDAMILTARHSVRENFNVDKICRDLLDIRLQCNKLAGIGELTSTLECIHRNGDATALLAISRILASYSAQEGASEAALRLSKMVTLKQQRCADCLVDVFFAQMSAGPFRKELLYLAHSKPLRQIFSGLRTNWREYRGVMKSMEAHLEGEEVPLAGRARSLAKAATSISIGQFRSIRTLARLKYNN